MGNGLRFLYKITARELSEEQSQEAGKYLRVLSDFERISDHARNIGEAVEEIHEKKIRFSDDAEKELEILETAVIDIICMTREAFVNNDAHLAFTVEPLEEVIDDLCDMLKTHHIERVRRQECTLENGFVFNDLITDYERIADHCSNVAIDVLETENHEVLSHEYCKKMNHRQNKEFQRYFEEFKQKYKIK